MQAIAGRVAAQRNLDTPPLFTRAGLKHALANVILAATFFVAAVPSLSQFNTTIANAVWIVGAAIMGVFSIVRVAPRAAAINVRTCAATVGMLLIPCLMRPSAPSAGAMAAEALTLEVIGVILTQVARIYMGRSFGLLPANRGIVSRGPFAVVRHPIYFGWMMLMLGYAMAFPSARNAILIVVAMPFLFWRIEQEESLLGADSEYADYRARVRFRLVPTII